LSIATDLSNIHFLPQANSVPRMLQVALLLIPSGFGVVAWYVRRKRLKATTRKRVRSHARRMHSASSGLVSVNQVPQASQLGAESSLPTLRSGTLTLAYEIIQLLIILYTCGIVAIYLLRLCDPCTLVALDDV
jgi:hypothetical protein